MKKLLVSLILLQPLQLFALHQKQKCHIQLDAEETLEDAGDNAGMFCPATITVTLEKMPIAVNTKVTVAGETDGTFFKPVDFYIYDNLMADYKKFHACTGKWGDYMWYQEYADQSFKIFLADSEVGATLTSNHCTYTCFDGTSPH
jgi:hypothetical protein